MSWVIATPYCNILATLARDVRIGDLLDGSSFPKCNINLTQEKVRYNSIKVPGSVQKYYLREHRILNDKEAFTKWTSY